MRGAVFAASLSRGNQSLLDAPQAALGAALVRAVVRRTFPAQTQPAKGIQPSYKHPLHTVLEDGWVAGAMHSDPLPCLGDRDPLCASGKTRALAGAFTTDHEKINLQHQGFYRSIP